MPRTQRLFSGTLRPALLLALLLVLLVLAGRRPAVAAGTPAGVLIAFKESAPPGDRFEALRRAGLQPDLAFGSRFLARVRLPGVTVRARERVDAMIDRLRRDPAVRAAEPDLPVRAAAVPNDPRFGEQWGLHNTGGTDGTPDADVDAPEAWDLTRGSRRVTVAVIDSGVDYRHPELKSNILRDASGAVVGYDFANDDRDPYDDNGHGTHMAGVVGAASNNRRGIAGVCPVVRLMPVKFLAADGTGSLAGAIAALDFARENGAHVINASWELGGGSQLLREALQRARDAGVLVVAAAGNHGADADLAGVYPAAYNRELDNVLAVGASDRTDSRAPFSSFGARAVDLMAPGVEIPGPAPGGGYRMETGTSAAAAHVSGAAALVLSRYPGLDLARLRSRLLYTADQPEPLREQCAHGRLNAAAALQEDATPPAAPTHLRLTHRGSRALRLAWAAAGDDGLAGAASRYDLRWSLQTITEASFAGASPVTGLPDPGPSGRAEGALLTGLLPRLKYFVALRAYDRVGNPSPLAVAGPLETLPDSGEVLLGDGAEGRPAFTGWAVTRDEERGSQVYSDSPGGPYRNNTQLSLTTELPVALPEGQPSLSFAVRTELEDGIDFLAVEVSAGSGWIQVARLTGTHGWTDRRIPLPALAGRSVSVRFRLVTDGSVVMDGVSLDDLRLETTPDPVTLLADDVEGAPHFTGAAPWAAAAEHAFAGRGYTDSPGAFYLDGLDLSLTQQAPVLLAGLAPELTFWTRTRLERGFDFLFVEVSADDGERWERLATLTGEDGGSLLTIPLDRYYGHGVRVRFRLVTDESRAADGVWVDEIRIAGEPLAASGVSPPEAPTELDARMAGGVRLAWRDNSPDEVGFRVERRTGEERFREIATVPADTTAFLDTTFQPNATYDYRVRAFNEGGPSPYSNEARVTALLDPPRAPEGLVAEPQSDWQVLLTWVDTSSTESAFLVERAAGEAEFVEVGRTPADVRTYADSGLEASTTYRYRVRARNAAGDSPYSEERAATTLPASGSLQSVRVVDFGRVPVGKSVRRTLSLWNRSAAEGLDVELRSPAAPFSLRQTPVRVRIPPGGSRTLTLQFTPTRRARFRDAVVLSTSDPLRPTARIHLRGSGR